MPTFLDYRERRQIIRQTFPDDLLEDLQDSEPELYNEAMECDSYLADFRAVPKTSVLPVIDSSHKFGQDLKSSVSPSALLPSILTPGWDRPKRHKYSKNWSDMENLLKLYAIGLYFGNQPLTYQAEHDKQELSMAAQIASISPKHKKGICAEERLKNAKTYLAFGLKTLDIFFRPNCAQKEYDMHTLDLEISDTSSDYNAEKLSKSKNMALRVGQLICNRYQKH